MKKWTAVLFILTTICSAFGAKPKQDVTGSMRINTEEYARTLGDQSNKPDDILTTKKIRTELMKDGELSMRAKNIQIITINKGITLKGDVKSANERERILKHAYITAPKYRIYNQLTVIK